MFNLETEALHVLVSVLAKLGCIFLILFLTRMFYYNLLDEVIHGSERFLREGEDRIRAAVIYGIYMVIAACVLGFMVGGVY